MLLLPPSDEEINYKPPGFDDVTTTWQLLVTSHLTGLVDVTHLASLSKISSFFAFLHNIDWLEQCHLTIYVTSFRPVCKAIHLTSYNRLRIAIEKSSFTSSIANLQLFHQPLLAIDKMIGKFIFWRYLQQYLTNYSQIHRASRYYIFPLCNQNVTFIA